MNFFGHATVALRESSSAPFLLGSMLPDLLSMASLRLNAAPDPDIARGIALHHATDERFHAAPVFRRLCESAVAELCAAGVSRGPARAVGHVGSELLLDGVLSRDETAKQAYRAALQHAIEVSLDQRVTLRDAEPKALQAMLSRLARAPLPDGYREVDFVCDRLVTILARRPRLALGTADVTAVQAWLLRAQAVLEHESAELMACV
jgi:acyl carrier protein phosphodiesterase